MTGSPHTHDNPDAADTPDTTGVPHTADAESGSPLQVQRRADPEAVVVLRGELDIASLPQAEREVKAAEHAAPPVLLIDLSELDFVDSSGIRLVMLADQRAREEDRQLAVRLGDGMARRVFELLGLLDRFDVVDTHP